MRYIKTNEQFEDDRLQKFCNQYLAYLIDDGLRVNVMRYMLSADEKNSNFLRSDENIIDINFLSMKTSNWSDIKDDIIPFITILDSRFNINTIFIGCFNWKNNTQTSPREDSKINTDIPVIGSLIQRVTDINDILNDTLDDDMNVAYFKITMDIFSFN
jgi:hypothetical protein